MTALVTILIPVLDRPERIRPIMESIAVATQHGQADTLFLASPDDQAELDALKAQTRGYTIVPWQSGPGDYARKINHGARTTDTPWVFTGADDLHFHPGWLDACLRVHRRTGAHVIGTNDLGNATVIRGQYATHLLVHRSYFDRAVLDEPGNVFCEKYSHNCNTGDAPIWMGDLSFKDLADVYIGDTVIGWERRPAGKQTLNRLVRAEVLSVMKREASVIELTMESGRRIRCTPDHLWYNPVPSKQPTRPEYLPAVVGRPLLHVIDVPEPVPAEHERLAGWIAGMYDGEGGGLYIATQSTALHPDIYETVGHVLDVLEIPYTRPAGFSRQEVGVYCMTGGRQAYLNFLLRIQPIKRDKLMEIIFNGNRRNGQGAEDDPDVGAARFGHQDIVESVRDAGTETVYALMTTSGNYVAWGYASKNCVDTECVETAKFQHAWAMAGDAHVEHLHHVWHKAPDDATYAKGRADHPSDRRLLQSRRYLWSRRRVRAYQDRVSSRRRR